MALLASRRRRSDPWLPDSDRMCSRAAVGHQAAPWRQADRLGMPVFARYGSPVQSLNRWRVTRSQKPVVLPGATGGKLTVRPGDWILADGDGVVAIGADVVGQVLDGAEALKREEA